MPAERIIQESFYGSEFKSQPGHIRVPRGRGQKFGGHDPGESYVIISPVLFASRECNATQTNSNKTKQIKHNERNCGVRSTRVSLAKANVAVAVFWRAREYTQSIHPEHTPREYTQGNEYPSRLAWSPQRQESVQKLSYCA